jgi:Peptidase S24-like
MSRPDAAARLTKALAAPLGKMVTFPKERFPGLSLSAYAVVAEGHGMAPIYDDGDIVVIDPARVPRPGDAVVLWRHDGGGECEARELVEKSSDAVRTRKAPLIRKIVGAERLAAMHVIVGSLKPAETTVKSARLHGTEAFLASISEKGQMI